MVLVVLYYLIYMRTKVALDKKVSGSLSTPVMTPERHSLTAADCGGATGAATPQTLASGVSSSRTSGSGHKQLMIGGHPHVVSGGGSAKVEKR